MWRGQSVAVVIPAFNEARLIGRTLARVPEYVDNVIVVDDASRDATRDRVTQCPDERVSLVRHQQNRGVGAAIVTGYEAALKRHSDWLAVMAADNQMVPDDLERLLEAAARQQLDYVKGNRFLHPKAQQMPLARRLGSQLLSALTRRATGLEVDDCQCGFTVLRANTARRLPLEDLWPRYGYPNDLLALLSRARAKVGEVPVTPHYADESSGLHAGHLFSIAFLILRRYFRPTGMGTGLGRPL